MRRYIGIDPGRSGSMAMVDDLGHVEIVPFDEEQYRQKLEEWKQDDVVCAVEKVSAFPGQGVSSVFNFGFNFGWILGLLYALRIPTNLVSPQQWKKALGLMTSKAVSKPEKKQKTIDAMKRMFPNVSLKRTERSKTDDDGCADALAIAEFCRRTY